jgi:hypothetical protein
MWLLRFSLFVISERGRNGYGKKAISKSLNPADTGTCSYEMRDPRDWRLEFSNHGTMLTVCNKVLRDWKANEPLRTVAFRGEGPNSLGKN